MSDRANRAIQETAIDWSAIKATPAARACLGVAEVLGRRLELRVAHGSAAELPKRDFRPDWERLHERWSNSTKDQVRQNPIIASYCDFYKAIGLNPKETPPSVLNIIQRFLLKPTLDRVPSINSVVDAVNIAAVETLIPLGIFDADCVSGELILDVAGAGDSYMPLGMNEMMPLKPGVLVLRDSEKVLSQFCYRDSEAQKVTTATRNVWLLGCQVPGVSRDLIVDSLERGCELLRRDFGVQVSDR